MKHQITSDGVTVWVNGERGLLGRFGRNGIDVHHAPSAQQTKGECLFCTHAPTTIEDWETFRAKMQEHYGIVVPRSHLPERFRSKGMNW